MEESLQINANGFLPCIDWVETAVRQRLHRARPTFLHEWPVSARKRHPDAQSRIVGSPHPIEPSPRSS